MTTHQLIILSVKGCLAWFVISVAYWFAGAWFITSLFPVMKPLLILISPDLSPSLKLIRSDNASLDYSIQLTAWVIKPIYLNSSRAIRPDTELASSVQLMHALVPVVIETTILTVWPVARWSQRCFLLASGLIMAIFVVNALLPAHLLGLLEMSLQDVALSGDNPRVAPWFLDWMVFCELGGRWLLGITAAWCCIALQAKLFHG